MGSVAGSGPTSPYPQGAGAQEANTNRSLDRRLERAIRQAHQQSQEGALAFYRVNQLTAFLDCLPRRIPEAAAEGLRYILDRANIY